LVRNPAAPRIRQRRNQSPKAAERIQQTKLRHARAERQDERLKHDANHALFDAADERTRHHCNQCIVKGQPRAQIGQHGHGNFSETARVIITERIESVKRQMARLTFRGAPIGVISLLARATCALYFLRDLIVNAVAVRIFTPSTSTEICMSCATPSLVAAKRKRVFNIPFSLRSLTRASLTSYSSFLK